MSKYRSPSTRWTAEHGFRRAHSKSRQLNGGKITYRSWWWARIHAFLLNRKLHDDLTVYTCYWGANYRDGETSAKHYHLGHSAGQHDMWGY